MKSISMLRALILTLFSCFSTFAYAEQNNQYVISGIEVDVTSKDVKEAQKEAFEEGQRKAFEQLLQKLTRQKETIIDIAADHLTAMIDSHMVETEKRSGVRYIAKLTFNFNRSKIENFLIEKGIEFNPYESRPVLIIPVSQVNNKDLLWEEENIWREEWEKASFEEYSIPCELPEGNLQDIQDLSAQEALTQNVLEVQKLIKRYKSQGAAIVYHSPDGGAQAWFVSNTGHVLMIPLTDIKKEEDKLKVIEDILNHIEQFIKTLTEWEATKSSHRTVQIHVQNQAQWISTQKSLKQIPTVKQLKVNSLSPKKIDILLDYIGDVESLQNSLEQHNLQLEEAPNGDWIIMPEAMPQAQN